MFVKGGSDNTVEVIVPVHLKFMCTSTCCWSDGKMPLQSGVERVRGVHPEFENCLTCSFNLG
jgi:hypothetical protein